MFTNQELPVQSSPRLPQGNGTGKLGRAETAPQLSPFLWVTWENPVNMTESWEGERPQDMGVWVTDTGYLCHFLVIMKTIPTP